MSNAETTSVVVEYEPFGQAGIRQHLGSLVVLVCLCLATTAAVMWYRSYGTSDALERNSVEGKLVFRSIFGRLVIARTDYQATPTISATSAWSYEIGTVPDTFRDGWKNSWKKQIGIEYDSSAFSSAPGVAGWYLLRIRWRTIMIVCAIPPIVHFIRQRRRVRPA